MRETAATDHDSQLTQTHTLKSHGFAIARSHLYDWLMVLFLMVMYFVIYKIHPFRRFVGKDLINNDLKYPLKGVSIPFWTVPLYGILLPILIFLCVFMKRRDVYDLHHAILGILLCNLATGVLTEATKNAVGSPRPDFFWRCFPDGIEVYDHLGNVVCHGKKGFVMDGYKSFPSGHASWSFAGLGFLSLYLSGKLKLAFDQRGHFIKLVIAVSPLSIAYVVGIFMVNDYMHRWQDVFVGALLGLAVATLCYLQFFPPPYHPQGWGPYDFFRASEQSRANAPTDVAVDVEAPPPPPPSRDEGGGDRNNISTLPLSLDSNPTSLS